MLKDLTVCGILRPRGERGTIRRQLVAYVIVVVISRGSRLLLISRDSFVVFLARGFEKNRTFVKVMVQKSSAAQYSATVGGLRDGSHYHGPR